MDIRCLWFIGLDNWGFGFWFFNDFDNCFVCNVIGGCGGFFMWCGRFVVYGCVGLNEGLVEVKGLIVFL